MVKAQFKKKSNLKHYFLSTSVSETITAKTKTQQTKILANKINKKALVVTHEIFCLIIKKYIMFLKHTGIIYKK